MQSSGTISSRRSQVLHSLFVVCKQLSLHHEENAIVKDSTEKLMQGLKELWSAGEVIQISVAKHNFLVDGVPLDPKNRLFTKFAYRIFQHGISSFSITPELNISALYSFLRLVMSKPADTWDQGGASQCMEQCNIIGIHITEMSKRDFQLLESSDKHRPLEQIQSAEEFWDRFAQSLFHSLNRGHSTNFDPDNASPAELAAKIAELFDQEESGTEREQRTLLEQQLTRSILAAQGQKNKTERMATYLKLAEFVNHMGNDFREDIIGCLCNVHMLKNNAENFFSGFSDNALLEAFKQSTEKKNDVSPIIMTLITKLAAEKRLIPERELSLIEEERQERVQKAKEILRSDEFEKYVPERYQKTLLQVLSTHQRPKALDDRLQQLKKHLESAQLEEQMANLSIYLLNSQPDQAYLQALQKQIFRSMEFYLGTADYAGLLNLCRNCLNNKPKNEIADFTNLIPETFYQQVLKDVARLGKEYHSSISEMIDLLSSGFTQPLLEIIAVEQNRAARLLFLNKLRHIGNDDNVSDRVVQFLNDKRWYVIRNMLLLLGQLGAKDKLSQIRSYLNHDHHRVRQEALKTCLLLKDTSALTQLYQSLISKDHQEILHAISMCGFINAPELTNKLLAMLAREQLFKFDFEVKKALAVSLAKQKDPQALAIFAKKLKAKRLFQARRYHKFKLEIIKALQNYSADQANPLLIHQINNGTGPAALQAKHVMNKLREGEKK